MTRTYLAFSVALISLCFSILLQERSFAQESNLIHPGIGVGILKLDAKKEEIDKIVGKYDEIKKVVQQNNPEMWLSYKKIGLTLVYDYERKTLKKIIVTNKALIVENTKISVGSSITDLRQYKNSHEDKAFAYDKDPKRKNIEGWDFVGLGIKFWINWNDQKIFAIEVKR